jgi:hypothetical protein
MKPYRSKSNKSSGVTAYHTGMDFIDVQFGSAEIYHYTYASAGEKVVEQMKALARANKGLSTFISRNDPEYENKYSG